VAEADDAAAFKGGDRASVLDDNPGGAQRLQERKGGVRAAAIWRESARGWRSLARADDNAFGQNPVKGRLTPAMGRGQTASTGNGVVVGVLERRKNHARKGGEKGAC
jgi:hypothetical protein